MSKLGSILTLVAMVGLWAGTGQAALIVGGSFESPDLADGTNNIVHAHDQTWSDGWTSADNGKTIAYGAGVEDPTVNVAGQLADQYAKMKFINGTGTNNQWIKIFSPLSGSAQAGYTYTVQVGATWDKAAASGAQPHWAGYNNFGLYVGTYLFDLTIPALPQLSFTDISFQIVLDGSGNLVSHTASSGPAVGTALAGLNMQMRLMGGRAASTDGTGITYMLFDNARLTGVPEPASLALLGIGGVGLLLRRRR